MNFIQREIYIEWSKGADQIWTRYNSEEIDLDQAIKDMRKLIDKLNKLEEAKVRLYGESFSDN